MKIRPLPGQVLVELVPDPGASAFELNPTSGKYARVREVGPWPMINGRAHLPQFKRGDLVVVPTRAPKEIRGITERLKILDYDEVLAVIS